MADEPAHSHVALKHAVELCEADHPVGTKALLKRVVVWEDEGKGTS